MSQGFTSPYAVNILLGLMIFIALGPHIHYFHEQSYQAPVPVSLKDVRQDLADYVKLPPQNIAFVSAYYADQPCSQQWDEPPDYRLLSSQAMSWLHVG
jgi:hypothetical protein